MHSRLKLLGAGAGVVIVAAVLARTSDELPTVTSPRVAEHRTAPIRKSPADKRITREISFDDTTMDMGDIVERTHFAFQPTDNGHVGGDRAYKVTTEGRTIHFEPMKPGPKGQDELGGAAVTLTTVDISRDGTNLVDAADSYTRTREGSLEASSPSGVTERLRNTAAGLEQDWQFDSAPSGTGDLDVAIETHGQTYVATNESGVHFADASTGLGVVYSHARWIDASGASTDVAVEYLANRLVMHVPAAVIDSSEYPAVLDPTIGTEFGIDSPVASYAVRDQWAPALGHSGALNGEFLVVWQDTRRSFTGVNSDIFGAHVNRNGVVLEPEGFLISGGAVGNYSNPAVEWDSFYQAYAVVFTKTVGTVSQGIVGVTLPNALSVTPSAQSEISTTSYAAHADAATIARSAYLTGLPGEGTQLISNLAIAWRETSGIWIRKANVGTGTLALPSSATQIRASIPGHTFEHPRIAGSINGSGFGSRFLLTYEHFLGATATNDIDADLFDQDVTWMTNYKIASNRPYGNPDVAFLGSSNSWIIVYDWNSDGLGNYDVIMLEVSLSTGLAPYSIVVAGGLASQSHPAIGGHGTSGTQGFVTWQEAGGGGHPQLKGVRVSPAGPLSPQVTIGGDVYAGRAPVHSDDFDRYFTVWADQRDALAFSKQVDVYGARIGWSGSLLDPAGGFLISKSHNSQTLPAIAYCNGNYLLAWSDTRSGYYNHRDLYGALLDASGAAVAAPIAISTAAGNQDSPAIACNGTNFYVVWVDERNGNRDIYGTMIDGTNGNNLIPSSVAITTATVDSDHPAIAYGGGDFKIVWDESAQIAYATVSGITGALLTSPVRFTGAEGRRFPDIAYDGSIFWVVWQEPPPMGSGNDIVGASLTPAGVLGSFTTIENNAADQRYPKLAFNNQVPKVASFTVVYEDDRNVTTGVYARTFTAAGTVNAAFQVANVAKNPRIAIQDFSRNPSLFEVAFWRKGDKVLGQAITSVGSVGSEYTIAEGTEIDNTMPAIACSSSTSCMVPYQSVDTQSVLNPVERIKARVVSY